MASRVQSGELPCPKCPSSDARKRWIKNHLEHARRIWREGAKRWRKSNKLSSLLISAKGRSKKQNILFNISTSDFINGIPLLCPVLGIPIIIGEGKKSDFSPSLDRINNKEGYIKGNVRVISYRANRLKSDMSIEECQLLLKDLECQQELSNNI